MLLHHHNVVKQPVPMLLHLHHTVTQSPQYLCCYIIILWFRGLSTCAATSSYCGSEASVPMLLHHHTVVQRPQYLCCYIIILWRKGLSTYAATSSYCGAEASVSRPFHCTVVQGSGFFFFYLGCYIILQCTGHSTLPPASNSGAQAPVPRLLQWNLVQRPWYQLSCCGTKA